MRSSGVVKEEGKMSAMWRQVVPMALGLVLVAGPGQVFAQQHEMENEIEHGIEVENEIENEIEHQPCGTMTATTGLTSFIMTMYQDILGRQPVAQEVDAWVAFLRTSPNRAGLKAVARAFLQSPEHAQRGETLRAYVDSLYHSLLNRREVEIEGQAWEAVFMAKVGDLVPAFVDSPEFHQRFATPRNRDTATALVRQLYATMLGRSASDAEVEAWVSYLTATGDSRGVAQGFFGSPEYRSRSRSAAEHVRNIYRAVLSREPAAPEVQAWVNHLQHRFGEGEEGFVSSTEFRGRCEELLH